MTTMLDQTAADPSTSASSLPHRRLMCADRVVVSRLSVADSMLARMKGLLGKRGLADDEGLWISPCNSIHMFFMRFAIDAVFVDRQLRVVRIVENLRPWRMARGGSRAHSVFELRAGRARVAQIERGMTLRMDASSST